jgi:hypothetical protein
VSIIRVLDVRRTRRLNVRSYQMIVIPTEDTSPCIKCHRSVQRWTQETYGAKVYECRSAETRRWCRLPIVERIPVFPRARGDINPNDEMKLKAYSNG